MGRRNVPRYWWDFRWVDNRIVSIIIESDADYLPNPIIEFCVIGDGPYDRVIERAVLPYIAGLEAGRINPARPAALGGE